MRKNIYMLVFMLLSFSCQDGCYSELYQIKKITPLNNGLCEYHTWGVGSRFFWTELSTFDFVDSCSVRIQLSSIISRDTLERKYGFNCN